MKTGRLTFRVMGCDLADVTQRAEAIIESFIAADGGRRTAEYVLDVSPEVWGISESAPALWRGEVEATIR